MERNLDGDKLFDDYNHVHVIKIKILKERVELKNIIKINEVVEDLKLFKTKLYYTD